MTGDIGATSGDSLSGTANLAIDKKVTYTLLYMATEIEEYLDEKGRSS